MTLLPRYFPPLNISNHFKKERMKKIWFLSQKWNTIRITDFKFACEVILLISNLSAHYRNFRHLIDNTDFRTIEHISTILRFLENFPKIVPNSSQRICRSAKSNKLWMIFISFCTILQYFLSQKTFSPNGEKSLSIKIRGM